MVERHFAWPLGCRGVGVCYERRPDVLRGRMHPARALVRGRFLISSPT